MRLIKSDRCEDSVLDWILSIPDWLYLTYCLLDWTIRGRMQGGEG